MRLRGRLREGQRDARFATVGAQLPPGAQHLAARLALELLHFGVDRRDLLRAALSATARVFGEGLGPHGGGGKGLLVVERALRSGVRLQGVEGGVEGEVELVDGGEDGAEHHLGLVVGEEGALRVGLVEERLVAEVELEDLGEGFLVEELPEEAQDDEVDADDVPLLQALVGQSEDVLGRVVAFELGGEIVHRERADVVEHGPLLPSSREQDELFKDDERQDEAAVAERLADSMGDTLEKGMAEIFDATVTFGKWRSGIKPDLDEIFDDLFDCFQVIRSLQAKFVL